MQRHSALILLLSVLILVIIGFVMLVSTCAFTVDAPDSDVYYEAKRQGIWLVVGVVAMCATALTDYRVWKRHVWWILGVTCFLLALCFLPGIGLEINGEKRWVGIGSFRIQPSETAKIASVILLAYWYSRYPDSGRKLLYGYLYPLALAGILMGLVVCEVDIGTTVVILTTTVFIMFVAGVNWKYHVVTFVGGIFLVIVALGFATNRIGRLMAFINPEEHRLGAGFQQWISLMALGSGGVSGRGIGEGRLKMLYMPFAQTDFIFPMIGEELGLVFTLLVVLCFITLAIAGYMIAYRSPDRFGALLSIGLVTYISLQAFVNIGVTTSLLPNKGIPLPFISYGGSSLVMSLIAVGIVINVYRQGRPVEEESQSWMPRGRITPRV